MKSTQPVAAVIDNTFLFNSSSSNHNNNNNNNNSRKILVPDSRTCSSLLSNVKRRL